MDTSKIIRANKLRRMRWSWDSIAKELNVSPHAIQYACDDAFAERHRARRRKAHVKRVRQYQGAPGLPPSAVLGHNPTPKPPQSVLFERERAMMAPRSLTAVAFGDPPAGRSALDKRGG